MEPWPLDSTKRSRSYQCGLPGLCFMKSFHNTSAISAMPIGAPGWPDFAFCTASMLNARMALASSRREDINLLLGLDPTLRFTESEYKGAIFAQIATSFKSICANGVFFMQ